MQVARTQLGRSTALGCELCESDLVGHAASLPHGPRSRTGRRTPLPSDDEGRDAGLDPTGSGRGRSRGDEAPRASGACRPGSRRPRGDAPEPGLRSLALAGAGMPRGRRIRRGGGTTMAEAQRRADAVWEGSLDEGVRSRHAHEQRRRRGAARHLGVAHRALQRQDQPRGARRGRARQLLLHGALRRPRPTRARRPRSWRSARP